MLHKGMTKGEIEKFLNDKGNFVQIDYLTRFLKGDLTMDMKKFVFLKLADIYERINMKNEAAKMYSGAATVSITFAEKIKHLVKETELYVKSGTFEMADAAMKKALNEANSIEKNDIYFTVKEIYKKQAEFYEKNLKRFNAMKAYEKLLEMNIKDSEKKEIKEKLLALYEKLGKTKEYSALNRTN